MSELTPPIVIGLTGKARAGKDTVARTIMELVTEYNDTAGVEHEDSYVVAAEAFAAPIKSMVAMLLDFFGYGQIMAPETLAPYIDGDKKEDILHPIGASARTMMQTLGTEWGRNLINEDIWLESMSTRIDHYKEAGNHGYKGSYVIVTDARFDNEADRLVNMHGAVIVNVVRDEIPSEVGEEGHQSELGIGAHHFTHTIINNGSLEDLVGEVSTKLADILPTPPIMASLGDVEDDEDGLVASA